MRYVYTTSDKVCSSGIILDIEDGVIQNVRFIGGCDGNTRGVAGLAAGMKAKEVIARLKDVQCGNRGSSCPAELAKALREALEKENTPAEDAAEGGAEA